MSVSVLVVIAHYSARSTEPLEQLLTQLFQIPAGHAFRVRVVINSIDGQPLKLARNWPQVEFLIRPNTGMNIGAWDHGWRTGPPADLYVFLQDECLIMRRGWLKRYVRAVGRSRLRIVGESLVSDDLTWEEWEDRSQAYTRSTGQPGMELGGQLLSPLQLRDKIHELGMPTQPTPVHLQTLVMATNRTTLEKVGGFQEGADYLECVACEFGFSQKAISLGVKVRQICLMNFAEVAHPQWIPRRANDRCLRLQARRLVQQYCPRWAYQTILNLLSLRRKVTGFLVRSNAN